jgi:CRP/FNR family transcriptional regulator, anaerobic regulatory protein
VETRRSAIGNRARILRDEDPLKFGHYGMPQATATTSPPVVPSLRMGTSSGARAVQGLSVCDSCSLRTGCLPRDLRTADLDAFSVMARLKRKIRHGASLFSTGDPLTAVYVVRSGTFKTVTVSRDGHPKITGFYLPGEAMGLDAISDRAYSFDAVALEDSEVCVLPIHQIESMVSAMPGLQKQLIRALSREISRDHGLMQLLGCMDAEQRVARFLLSLAERYHRLGYASDALLLHMTREEIASYLGLSSETVSRVISRLRRKGLLTVHQRHIGFTDSAQLTATSAW